MKTSAKKIGRILIALTVLSASGLLGLSQSTVIDSGTLIIQIPGGDHLGVESFALQELSRGRLLLTSTSSLTLPGQSDPVIQSQILTLSKDFIPQSYSLHKRTLGQEAQDIGVTFQDNVAMISIKTGNTIQQKTIKGTDEIVLLDGNMVSQWMLILERMQQLQTEQANFTALIPQLLSSFTLNVVKNREKAILQSGDRVVQADQWTLKGQLTPNLALSLLLFSINGSFVAAQQLEPNPVIVFRQVVFPDGFKVEGAQ